MAMPLNLGGGDEAEREAAFIERVQSLPTKPRRQQKKTTLRDLVVKYYPILKPAQERGQTYEELSLIFEEELGVSISSGTLRKYMAFARTHSADETELPNLPTDGSTKVHSAPTALPVKPKSTAMSPERREALIRHSQSDDIESEFRNL